jgi:hypothetical protein
VALAPGHGCPVSLERDLAVTTLAFTDEGEQFESIIPAGQDAGHLE